MAQKLTAMDPDGYKLAGFPPRRHRLFGQGFGINRAEIVNPWAIVSGVFHGEGRESREKPKLRTQKDLTGGEIVS